MKANDISWLSMILGSLIIAIPVLLFQYYKTSLAKDSLVSFLRMSLQLSLVGIYLKYIFEYNSIILNFLWVIIMMVAAGLSVVKRSNLNLKKFLIPIILSILLNVTFNGLIFGTILIGFRNLLDPHYLIPIMGMVIGNTLNSTIMGIRTYFNNLNKDYDKYKYALICGATHKEAVEPFISKALKESFTPVIASNAAIGLIWLPGMMTGQILGGSSPLIAIKYQIMIVLAIFVGGVMTLISTILLSQKSTFNKYDLLHKDIFQK